MFTIYGLNDWQWWFFFVWTAFSIVISWMIPGWCLLSFTPIKKIQQFYTGPVLGLVLWTLQGYFFGWLHLRWLTIPYIVIFLALSWWRRHKILPFAWRLSLHWIAWLLILLGSVFQIVPVFASGLRYNDGIAFYFVNADDGLFHLSLARSIIEHFPPVQPGAVGLLVTNYHYLSNLSMAELTRIWQIPLSHLYFQYVPVFFSLWFGFLIVLVLQNWTTEKTKNFTIIMGLIFFYFSGELSWLLNIILGNNSQVGFDVVIDHGILQFQNPPQAFAKIVFFASLVLWHQFWKKKTFISGFILALMTASMLGFKVYFGLAQILGFGLACIYTFCLAFVQTVTKKQSILKIFIRKDTLVMIFVALVIVVVGGAIYLPTNAQAGGLFFDFLTWPKLLLGAQKLNWNEWWLRLQVYQAAGNTKALFVWYSIALAIFLTSTIHLRMIGLFTIFPKMKNTMLNEEVIFLIAPAVLFVFVGINFLQTSGLYNSFNFIVVALVPLNLLTAVVLGQATKYGKPAVIGVLALTCVILVQTVKLEWGYFSKTMRGTDRRLFTHQHLDALQFIRSQPTDFVVQTFKGNAADDNTPYIYFFTGKQTYYGGRQIIESHNQPIHDRKKVFESGLLNSPQATADNHISGLFLLKSDESPDSVFTIQSGMGSQFAGWQPIFKNDEVIILKPLVSPPLQ